MCGRHFIVLGVALALGCAAGGGTATPSEGLAPGDGVELVVRNEQQSRFSALVQWRGGNPVRLGDLGGGATSTFQTHIRGSEMRVIFRSVGGRGNQDEPEYVPARAGDRLEWTLLGDLAVFYRRLGGD